MSGTLPRSSRRELRPPAARPVRVGGGRGSACSLLRVRRPVLLSVLVAAALGAIYVAVSPPSADLAAAVFRSDLFAREGALTWSNAWYGGHHLPAYSVLMPPLGALLGPQLAAALGATAAAGLFAALVERAFPRRGAWVGALWFAAAIGLQLLTGRVPFLLGLPIGLAALLAAQRGRPALAVALAVATPLASPVAGAFLALAGLAWTVGAGRRLGLGLAAAALAPVALLNALFSEGGTEPFVASAFWPAFAALVALAVALPRAQRVLRAGAALYAVAVLACFVVPTAVGGNVTRLATLTAGPLVACVVGTRRPLLLAAVALPFVYWQAMPPIRDTATAAGDPSTEAAFYTPLVERLDGATRVEVPFTRAHWEAAHLAEHVPLARGWVRQLDRDRNALFYDDAPLTGERYADWLRENAVSHVALADVALDGSAEEEAALIRDGEVPGLRELWHDDSWRLFAVDDPAPLGATELTADGFAVERSGDVRVRFSPHFAVVEGAGCVSEAPGGFTRVRVDEAPVRVAPRVAPMRALLRDTGARCTGSRTGNRATAG